MQLEYRIKKITREKKQKIIKSKIKVIFSEKSLPKIKMEKQQSFAK
jgi:predicted GIY-YIG superfamily endonuclease